MIKLGFNYFFFKSDSIADVVAVLQLVDLHSMQRAG